MKLPRCSELVQLTVPEVCAFINDKTPRKYLAAVIREETKRASGVSEGKRGSTPRAGIVNAVHAVLAEMDAQAAKTEVAAKTEAPVAPVKAPIQEAVKASPTPDPSAAKRAAEKEAAVAAAKKRQFVKDIADAVANELGRRNPIDVSALAGRLAFAQKKQGLVATRADIEAIIGGLDIAVKSGKDISARIDFIVETLDALMNSPESEGNEETDAPAQADAPPTAESAPAEEAPITEEDAVSDATTPKPVTGTGNAMTPQEFATVFDAFTDEQRVAAAKASTNVVVTEGKLEDTAVGKVTVLTAATINQYNNGAKHNFIPRFNEGSTYVTLAFGVGAGLVVGKLVFGASADADGEVEADADLRMVG